MKPSTLPFAAAAKEGVHALPSSEGNAASPAEKPTARRILVIDDHVETAESLAVCLRCEGYDARFECSSTSGIAMTNSWLPDIVILDADMPEPNGFETAAIIRNIVPNPDLIIIAFTGLDWPMGPERALEAGFDSYCQKGLPLRTLLDTIETVSATSLR